MPRRQYIIYCDESAEKGTYFSHFYGGVLISAQHRQQIDEILNEKKERLHLHKELKWTYITEQYEEKYKSFIDRYFDLIEEKLLKVRIMFTQNIYRPSDLKEYQLDNQYFLLYYQLVKHAFGLRYCNPESLDEVLVSLYLDDVPGSQAKFDEFKDYLHTLCHYPVFRRANVMIPKEEITDVRSHDHVTLQGLDIILGSTQFRLNDKHKVKLQGQRIRGKRTRAKERVYNHIRKKIQAIYPGFNIGISTGVQNGPIDRWEHPYRHWRFIPTDHNMDRAKGKRHQKKDGPAED